MEISWDGSEGGKRGSKGRVYKVVMGGNGMSEGRSELSWDGYEETEVGNGMEGNVWREERGKLKEG